jgi:hypothetical protein
MLQPHEGRCPMITHQPVKFRNKIAEGPEGLQITIPPRKVSAILGGSCGFILVVMTGAWAVWTLKDLTVESLAPPLMALLTAVICIVSALKRTILILKPNYLVARMEVFRIGWTRVFNAGELSDLRSWWESDEDTDTAIIFVYRGRKFRFSSGQLVLLCYKLGSSFGFLREL